MPLTMAKSWDFWDTLVTRCVPHPHDIFDIVGQRCGVADFRSARVQAELRSRVGVAETTLRRIYAELHYESALRDQLCRTELEIEAALASPIAENVRAFRSEDLVISDMYLDRDTLLEIARGCGLQIHPERLVLSSAHGTTKHAGNLYDVAHRIAAVTKHVGDNRHSDVTMARRRGIAGHHYDGAEPTRHERRWLTQGGDARLFGGVMRAARLANPVCERSVEWDLYAQWVAPLLVEFVEWILEDAQKRGIRHLFFLSRDGQMLRAIAERLIAARQLPLSTSYFLASRQALHLPGHHSIEESESWLLEDTALLTLETIARRARIPMDELRAVAQECLGTQPDVNLDAHGRQQARRMIRSPGFEALLKQKAQSALKDALAYFRQEGLLRADEEPLAVIDVGWHARLQRSIDNIRAKAGVSGDHLHGYYLSLSGSCVYSDGARVHGFMHSPFDPERRQNDWADRYRGMFEVFLEADHPSVLAYLPPKEADGTVEIEYGTATTAAALSAVEHRRQAVLAYVDAYVRLTQVIGRRLQDPSRLTVRCMFDMLTRPSAAQAAVFLSREHSEHQTETDFVPLVRSFQWHECWRSDARWRFGVWPEGSHALSGTLPVYRLRRRLSALRSRFRGRSV
jgi:hypothetical protein